MWMMMWRWMMKIQNKTLSRQRQPHVLVCTGGRYKIAPPLVYGVHAYLSIIVKILAFF